MKKINQLSKFWKGIILATFIISIFCLALLIKPQLPSYSYTTKLIILDNTNTVNIDGKVVDYICDENVYVSRLTISYGHFYASTWRDGKVPHSYGECFVKIKHKD